MPLDSIAGTAPSAPSPMTEDCILVHCGRAGLWRCLTTAPPLPRWSPVFNGERAVAAGAARPGTCRSWGIVLGRRNGRVTGRCIAAVTGVRLAYVLESETAPLARFLAGLTFSFALEEADGGKTVLRLRTYYPQSGALGRLLRRPAIQRRFRGLRMAMLRNLKSVAERDVSGPVPGQGAWAVRAVVPPVMLLTKER